MRGDQQPQPGVAGACLRAARDPARVRAGRLRRPRVRRRGGRPRAARPGARDGAHLRDRPAAGDARSRRRAADRPPARAARRARAGGAAARAVRAAVPRRSRRARRRERERRAGQTAAAACRRPRQRRPAPRRRGRGGHARAGSTTSPPRPPPLLHSVPGWLASQWWDELGADEARALLRVVNEPAESALRVNSLVATVEQVAAGLPVPSPAGPGAPRGARARRPVRRPGVRAVAGRRGPAAVAGIDAGVADARAPARASACSICARLPAARRHIWPR